MQKLFQKNIQFFYNELPHLYNIIKKLKKRNYYIKNDNLFDNSNKPLYKNSISEDSKKLAYFPTHNPLWEKKFFYLDPVKWDKDFFITGKIINRLIQKTEKLDSFTKHGYYFDKDFLPTTAVFGLLAGKHLDILAENFEFQSLFVYEPNPEFFAISLYFTDYEKIYEKLNDRFFLWVGGTLDYFAIEKFYFERKITSSFLTLTLKTYTHPLIEDAINKFEEIRISKLRGWGTYEDELKGVQNYLQNKDKYQTLNKSLKLNIPFCIAANGKSLEKNIPFIRKNQNSMIIISVGTAIKPLIQAGIHSDFHIEQERIDILTQALKNILPDFKGIFVGANVVNNNVFKMAKKPYMYNREAFALSEDFILKGSSPLVGNAGFAFAVNFTDEIYLCGMDLGFRLNEKKHADGSFYDDKNDREKSGIKIKGNFSDDIYTDSLFLSSKQNIEKMIEIFNLNVYNLSDGAYISNTVPLKDKTLREIDKSLYIDNILDAFQKRKHKLKKLNFNSLLSPVNSVLNKKINNYKELTGLIDFIDNNFNAFYKTYPKEYILLRGSLTHILNNLYILTHKINIKDFKFLTAVIKKHLYDYQKNFNKLTDKL